MASPANSGTGVTSSLCRRLLSPIYDTDVPKTAMRTAEATLIDTCSVALAARHEEAVEILRQHVSSNSVATTARADYVTLLEGSGQVRNEQAAALINGCAAHALDFDDVTDAIEGHLSSVLWPTILAVAESERSAGYAMFSAYLAAYDVAVAIAAGLRIGEHYRHGWHSTATIGVVAATAAAARLMNCDTQQAAYAIGMATSMAGGSRQNFGTMTKPLHVGLAARNAIFAARMARLGFTADASGLEGRSGFFELFGDRSSLDQVLGSLDKPFSIDRHGVNVKQFAACFNVQSIAEAGINISQRLEQPATNIRRIVVKMEEDAYMPLMRHFPKTGLEGKFSAEYIVAASLLDRSITLSSFTNEAVARPSVQRLIPKVTTDTFGSLQPRAAGESGYRCSLQVSFNNGDQVCEAVGVPSGHFLSPLREDDLINKFNDCVSYSGATIDANDWLRELRTLKDVPKYSGFTNLSVIDAGDRTSRVLDV